MVAIMEFQSVLFYLFWFTSHLHTPIGGFEPHGYSVKEKDYETYFQDSVRGSHLGFPTGTIKLFLIYKSSQYFLPSLESIGRSI